MIFLGDGTSLCPCRTVFVFKILLDGSDAWALASKAKKCECPAAAALRCQVSQRNAKDMPKETYCLVWK
jgi:hypothetical protein